MEESSVAPPLGIKSSVSEKGVVPAKRKWSRPSIRDLNGPQAHGGQVPAWTEGMTAAAGYLFGTKSGS